MDWLTPVSSLVAAVIGGWIAGWCSIRAQDKATIAERKRDRETERAATCAILRAVRAELNTFHENFLIKLEEIFKGRDAANIDARTPLGIAPLRQNYFVVFDSNAAALGKIEDPKLLEKMVRDYAAAKSLLDAINHNSQQLYQCWDNAAVVKKLNEFAVKIQNDASKRSDRINRPDRSIPEGEVLLSKRHRTRQSTNPLH